MVTPAGPKQLVAGDVVTVAYSVDSPLAQASLNLTVGTSKRVLVPTSTAGGVVTFRWSARGVLLPVQSTVVEQQYPNLSAWSTLVGVFLRLFSGMDIVLCMPVRTGAPVVVVLLTPMPSPSMTALWCWCCCCDCGGMDGVVDGVSATR